MADDGSARSKQQGLQQAASVIFALVAVVPLLIFAWTLHTLGAIRSTQAQVSLGLALGVALLGYWLFRSMLGRMAEVVQALAAAVEQANRTRRPAGAAPAAAPAPAAATAPVTGLSTAAPAAVAATVTAESPALVTATAVVEPPPAPAPPPAGARVAVAAQPAAASARAVPGIGKIRELTEVMRTMDALWYREATAHIGRRVQISVANSREPLIGTLTEATDDGLILEQPDGPLAVAYGRVTSIDRLNGH